MKAKIEASDYIQVHLDTTLENVEGFIGNFKAYMKGPDGDTELKFGTAIIASGFGEIDLTGR